MNESNKTGAVKKNVVVTLDYTVMIDGEIVETSEGHEPLQFIQGQGQIVSGLERELYGMSAGEGKDVVVTAADGYGEEDPDAVADVPRSEFPPEIPLNPGVKLQLTDQEGEELQAYITSVGKETVRLNFNHPLAGKDLNFSVKVIDLREATNEELDHGHVHL